MSFRGFRDNTPKTGPTRPQRRGDAKTTIYLPPDGKVPPPDPLLQLNSEYPPRPGYGTKGKPVVLWANYFHSIPDPNLVLYRYAIDVRPSVSGRKLAQIVRLVLEAPEVTSMTDNLVTDYKSTIISRERLPLADNAIIVPVFYRSELEDEPAEDAAQYRARILYTNTLRVSQLIEYLTSTNFIRYDEKLPMIQALNILLNHYPMTYPDLVSRGGNRANRTFPLSNKAPQSDKAPLIGGLTAIRGFFSSVRLAAGRVLVNVNVSHGAFYNSGRLVDLIDAFPKANGRSLGALNEFLSGIRGRTLHLPERRNRSGELIIRPKTIYSLARCGDGTELLPNRPPEIHSFGAGSKGVKFWLESRQVPAPGSLGSRKKKSQQSGPVASPAGPARLISVYDYFLETYNIRDQRPDLPVINIGTRASPTYQLAQEFEILPGQIHNGKLSSAQTQGMIKFAVRPPLQNALSIVSQGADTVGLNPGRNVMLGRVLDQPNIMYRGKSSVKTLPGSWNLIDTKFNVSGQRLRKWSYLLLSDKKVQDTFPDLKSLQPVVKKLQAALLDTGVLVDAPIPGRIIRVDKDDTADLENRLKGAADKLDLLYIIFPEKDSRWYPGIKRLCEVEYGLQTICSVGPRLVAKEGQLVDQYDKALDQYMRNVAMKFNLKLGGTNHVVDNLRLSIINEDKTMIVGLDVTHPTGSSQVTPATAPSVAAMVASIDKRLGQWPATIQLQSRGGKEEIDSLDGMLKRHLRLWKLLGGHASFPENIIVFRDGISEGQYTKCLTEELPLMRKACREGYPKEMQEKNLPKFTIIIVSKRHHTRFYPTEVQTPDKNGNTPPCTIVDRCTTDPHCFSFFLQPHSAIHGTARNAFYFVILDEVFTQRYKGKLPPKYKNVAEIVQDLTLNLSYLVGRATKGVRVCCPARYADLVCDRARFYLSRFYEPWPETSSVASDASTVLATNKDVLLHEKIRNTMFYI
ncbi:ribonuclease H-like domain-containing protein [Aspergillus caelatus]|uniref:Ribonuclease H-like domain-containing protein n=1 Tax=Aspergillus caelatus TaxID=61420 RepID=A0A5N7A9P9_9EURO|nr:ribonuclease H-like domain-containing protein [Aspergillus caelatus]KAE8366363.1 ribonuclease H-like domain-containing protein [Aspergillus caelatus]